MKNINWHHVRMVVLISLIALIGALTAVKEIGIGGSWIDTVLSFLVLLEHLAEGNSAQK